jgi:hypothetical protein
MSKAVDRLRVLLALAAIAIAASSLCACGGSGEGGKVVATVGQSKITQATLNHWMETTVAGDYRELNAEDAPEGLVSDPPHYSRCVAAIKTIPTRAGGPSKLSDAQLGVKCRQLYIALKEQALSLVISQLSSIEEAAELGVHVSQAEVGKELNRIRYEQYPNPAQFRRFLAQRHRSLSDERALIRRNLIDSKLVKAIEAKAGSGAGGKKTFVKLVLAKDAKWVSRTHCMPGYRSLACKQYASGTGVYPTAALLVEKLKAGT